MICKKLVYWRICYFAELYDSLLLDMLAGFKAFIRFSCVFLFNNIYNEVLQWYHDGTVIVSDGNSMVFWYQVIINSPCTVVLNDYHIYLPWYHYTTYPQIMVFMWYMSWYWCQKPLQYQKPRCHGTFWSLFVCLLLWVCFQKHCLFPTPLLKENKLLQTGV